MKGIWGNHTRPLMELVVSFNGVVRLAETLNL